MCGKESPESAYLDINGGLMNCAECVPYGDVVLSKGALNAARYVLGCELKKILSFSLKEAAVRELAYATEKYLLTQLDRQFRTLDFYNRVKG